MAWGLLYACIAHLLLALSRGQPFAFDWRFGYVASLLFTSFLSTVVAFQLYLRLLGRLGPGRVRYANVLEPAIALALSGLFEGYRWMPVAVAGLTRVMAGNLIVLARGKPPRTLGVAGR